jgi:hypothetical protein
MLKIGDRLINTHGLIDCGSTRIAFVDTDFVFHHLVEGKELQDSRQLEVIDGRPID